uniref:Homeobox domain-containing protein n=1 Tax=Ciona savignyi TaxID=51511 RepID=H2YWW2_CIOSA
MKLNFSIDFILGKTTKRKVSTEDRRTSGETENAQRSVRPVQWSPGLSSATRLNYPSRIDPTTLYHPIHIPHSDLSNQLASTKTSPGSIQQSFHPKIHRRSPQQIKHSPPYFPQCSYVIPAADTSSSDESDAEIRKRLSDSYQSKGIIKNEPLNSSFSSSPPCSKSSSGRVGRRLFTGYQILELDRAFSKKPYLTRSERAYLAQKVNLTECQIKTWFQNRRTKEKRRGPETDDDDVFNDVISSKPYFPKATRVPGHGVQVRPTFGPPDKHLQAAIFDYLRRQSNEEISVK